MNEVKVKAHTFQSIISLSQLYVSVSVIHLVSYFHSVSFTFAHIIIIQQFYMVLGFLYDDWVSFTFLPAGGCIHTNCGLKRNTDV